MSKKNDTPLSDAEKAQLATQFEDSMERMHTCNEARSLLGLKKKFQVALGDIELKEMLPRYRVLGICIRGALYGFQNSTVKHMVQRNRELDEFAALERMAKAEGLA